METLTTMFIHTPWRQSHKWDVTTQGLVNYNDLLITPQEVYDSFRKDYPEFTILCAQVCQRIDNPEGSAKPYSWVELQRFDR
jgi:hypothetical protein